MTIALVMPTIRENCFTDFVYRWAKLGLFRHVKFYVMEDNPEPTFQSDGIVRGACVIHDAGYNPDVVHLSWKDIERDFGKDSWIIPRRSDTVRSYAYWAAWRDGHEYVLTLDDDCYPPRIDGGDCIEYEDAAKFLAMHLGAMRNRSRWLNTLTSVKPRGVPFYNIGKDDGVVLNHGLWTNVLDYDAPYQLANPVEEKFACDTRVVPSAAYFPMCGMNVMWRADITPLMYHMLMGRAKVAEAGQWGTKYLYDDVGKDKFVKLPFDRFGDIWCGIFMKKIVDELGLRVSTGLPYVRHERASNPFANLKKEAAGIEVNEKLWEYVDSWHPGDFLYSQDIAGTSALLYEKLGEHVMDYDEFPEHADYFKKLGTAMVLWAGRFLK